MKFKMNKLIYLILALGVLAGCNTVQGIGKDIEKVVLARGLRAVVEDRVLLAGNNTVIFR